MRNTLSQMLCELAAKNPEFVVLSGDHGYALFDAIRKEHPRQFVNVGIAEQGLVGYAAGLAKLGFRPVVYGLAAFVPLRVLEQIKLDVCYPRLPVIFLGDGAGLVYSTLGCSHQCGEDIAAARPLPDLRIYSPADASELAACLKEASSANEPSYIRIGKSDRPEVHSGLLDSTDPIWIHRDPDSRIALLATGSMSSIAKEIAQSQRLNAFSVPRLKPFPAGLLDTLASLQVDHVVTLEEHCKWGGLGSIVAELLASRGGKIPRLHVFGLEDRFSQTVGSHQHVLSEHGMSDSQLRERVSRLLKERSSLESSRTS